MGRAKRNPSFFGVGVGIGIEGVNCFVHFLCLPKENEPKERAPVPLGPADCLALLEAAGILQTRFAQTCKILFGSFSGAQQVPMGKIQQPLYLICEGRRQIINVYQNTESKMRKFPKTEDELTELAAKLNITKDVCANSAGLDRAELQRRILAMLAERRNSSLWIVAVISSIASVISAVTAIIAVSCN